MSMVPTTNSDSEDDLDYVPPADDHDSDSSSNDLGEHATELPPQVDPTEQKKQRDALWASFQASVSVPSSRVDLSTNDAAASPSVAKRVKIEKTYLFAGKHITEVVEVAEDSEEATKWPHWSPPSEKTEAEGKREDEDKGTHEPTATSIVDTRSSPDSTSDPVPPTSTITAVAPSTATATQPSTPSEVKRPGPRKPRTALPSIPKGSQAKKITTLDKCAMDWRAHVASQSGDVKDDLDANRRGGGYLEKMEFLKRVGDRREDAFEASKVSKRRKT